MIYCYINDYKPRCGMILYFNHNISLKDNHVILCGCKKLKN